jgi:hypothetical protein
LADLTWVGWNKKIFFKRKLKAHDAGWTSLENLLQKDTWKRHLTKICGIQAHSFDDNN